MASRNEYPKGEDEDSLGNVLVVVVDCCRKAPSLLLLLLLMLELMNHSFADELIVRAGCVIITVTVKFHGPHSPMGCW